MPELTREQIGEMVAEMENAVCHYTYKAGVAESDQDDVKQELRMNLCTAATRFDPARGVKWSSYAIKWIVNYLRNRRATMGGRYVECQSEDFADFAAGRSSRFEDDDHNRHRVTEEEVERDAPLVALSLAVKRSLAEPILATLTRGQRELIEALVFGGFTVEQFAEQRQCPARVVRCNLKNALRSMAEAGLVDHVMSDADAGRMLNDDQAPIRRNPDSTLSQRLERARSATDHERKRAASAAKDLRGAAEAAELKRGFLMRRAANHPDANRVLDALGADVAGAVRDYLAGACSFNDAAARVGLTPPGLGNKCRHFRKLARHGYNPPDAAFVAQNRAELSLARAASRRARHDTERRAVLELAVRQPGVESVWASLGDDMRVAVLGYLSREWTFEQAAELLGMNTKSLGKLLQRLKKLAAVEVPVNAGAVPERNSGDPIAAAGHPLTA